MFNWEFKIHLSHSHVVSSLRNHATSSLLNTFPVFGQPESVVARSVDASPHLAAVQQLRQHGGRHVFVLVHGYQGNSYDMHLFRNVLQVHYPDAAFLCSASNEGATDSSIDDMASRLAREVADFVTELGGVQRVARLSFVAHSLGGLIVRASLSCAPMRVLIPKLHTLVTLASPHCGYLFSESRLLRSGIALMQRWTNSTCLQQARAIYVCFNSVSSAPAIIFIRAN